MQIHAPADAARAIKSRRLALGLTQLEAAQAIGITRQSLARIEQANGGGAFDTYLRLFDLLGIALSAELPSAADEPAESMPDASGVSRGGARFLPEGATSWPGAAPSLASREQVAGDRFFKFFFVFWSKIPDRFPEILLHLPDITGRIQENDPGERCTEFPPGSCLFQPGTVTADSSSEWFL